ncbi:MAG: sulfurtransferase, partial [Micromonosporaceae bacterium]
MTGNPLITSEQLAELLQQPVRPVVLDVRWRLGGPSGRQDYASGHIPGAVFLDLDTDICGPPGARGRHPLPDPGHLQAVLRRVGISGDSQVVVYDGSDAMAAARTWWTLRWAGLEQVRVLDGGFAAWDGPISTQQIVPSTGAVVVHPGGMPAVDADGAATLASRGRLADVRTPQRYRGESEPIDPVAGHIPGAVNVPGGDLGPDGRFLAAGDLRERYAGLPDDGPVGAYCGSGVTAARAVLGMTVAGLDPVLY